jgi:hypothetical protein
MKASVISLDAYGEMDIAQLRLRVDEYRTGSGSDWVLFRHHYAVVVGTRSLPGFKFLRLRRLPCGKAMPYRTRLSGV